MSTLFYIASKLCLLNAECMTHMNVDVEVRQVSCASVLQHKHITGENISVCCCDAVVADSPHFSVLDSQCRGLFWFGPLSGWSLSPWSALWCNRWVGWGTAEPRSPSAPAAEAVCERACCLLSVKSTAAFIHHRTLKHLVLITENDMIYQSIRLEFTSHSSQPSVFWICTTCKITWQQLTMK